MDEVIMRNGPQQHQQQAEPLTPFIPTQSWYPPSVIGHSTSMASSSRPARSPLAVSEVRPRSPATQSPQSLPSISNALPALKDKSAEDLRTLLMDKNAYNSFLHSLDQVRHLVSLRDDLKAGNIELARSNLTKDAEIAELRNQCMIIRNTQLAAAREKFEEVQKREREIVGRCSPASLLDRLGDAAAEADEESERIHQQVLAGEIDIGEFITSYKKQRILYHKRTLTRLAAMTSLTTPG